MTAHYPRIRLQAESGMNLAWEAVHICFYIRRHHREISQEVLRSLELFLAGIAPQTLSHYADLEGEWQELDKQGWGYTRRALIKGARISLIGASSASRFAFEYRGFFIDDSYLKGWPGTVCAVSFQVPTEYLEARGPEQVRNLAMQLAASLPIASGHAGLAICGGLDLLGVMDALRESFFRYPGLDIEEVGSTAIRIGTGVRGPAWLTFLGQPALDGLGGVSGLRDKLHSPGTTVEEMHGGRAVITLGTWPEAGDLEQGNRLPAYRELARVLEPWLYQKKGGILSFSPEESDTWKRRFLD